MIIIIPAYQPDYKLIRLVEELKENTDYAIVIVNDGSSPDRDEVFSALESSATILRHPENRGKGAAIKTALNYVYQNRPEADGVVTVDADGQHLVKDIIRVVEAFQNQPDALVLGSRRFTGKVPFKSMAGNTITRVVFRLSTGVKVYDTQTGLRAFSYSNIPAMLAMKGERYEYEINVLLYATRNGLPIFEVPIDTVYIDDNASSHFHPIRDAWRIYKMILLFVASSLFAAALDYILVLLFSALFRDRFPTWLLLSVVGARIISSLANYLVNRKIVFESKNNRSVIRYYLLALLILSLNYGLMAIVTGMMPIAIGKILVELILYPLSFYLQRKYVFAK